MTTARVEDRLRAAFLTFLALIPPLVVLFLIGRHAVNIPFHDEWEWSIRRVLNGDLLNGDFAAFWELKNEHRVFIPTLLGTALAQATNMNMLAPIYAKVLLSLGILAVLACIYRRGSDRARSLPVLIPLSVLLFGLAQWPRWMDVRPLPSTISTLGFLAAVLLVGTGQRSKARFAGALVCTWISSASYFSGNIAWFAIGVLLLATGWARRSVLLWTGLSLVVWIEYGLELAAIDTPTGSSEPRDLGTMLRFFLIFLGSGCSTAARGAMDQSQALYYGLSGVTLLGALAILIARDVERGPRKMLPWLCLGCWILANAAAASFGRVAAAGELGGRAWRYTAFGAQFWIAVCMLSVIALTEGGALTRARTRCVGFLGLIIVTLGAVGGVLGMLDSGGLTGYKQKLAAGRRNLLLEEALNRAELNPLHPNPQMLRDALPELIERRAAFLYGERRLRPNEAASEGVVRPIRRSYGSHSREVISATPGSSLAWDLRVLDRPFAYFSCGLAGDEKGPPRTVTVRVVANENEVELFATTYVPTDRVSDYLRLDLREFKNRRITLRIAVSGRGPHRVHLVEPAVIYDVLERPRP